MIVNKIIIHELIKRTGSQETELIISEELIPLNSESEDLIETLIKSYQGDKISYAEFDESPGKYFPEKYRIYLGTERNPQDFIEFTRNVLGNLETIIKTKNLAKGGYIVFTEYISNQINFISIFLIRDTEGKFLKRTGSTYEINRIAYLDTSHLAMACRINENKINLEEQNYLSFIQQNQQAISDYFADWISIRQLESSTEFTNALYKIINALPLPINPETEVEFTIDEVRNMVYENAKNNAQGNINLRSLSLQVYGNANNIIEYAEDNHISIDGEFRYNRRALKRFIQVSISKDGITLKYSRGEENEKVRLSEESENIVIIESKEFANALRKELSNND